jgi:hypothetical protein
MGFEIFIYILRWVTELIGKICDLPPAHPSSYFMTSPLKVKICVGQSYFTKFSFCGKFSWVEMAF